ncbi:DNA-3-methyladenine glycosylase I [Rhodococcus rhodochrous]|uniref:3-methyladenine DNA glycosylase n=1 Tax=Rhodococcus rhodochrous KG-21 TaxID=1441923 RepID=A0A0M8PK95_RHORH|nr:DNA-3-methyladenine glycosylase I [Rhodococcus rhodochrous]KOS56655.1 3-methyladenine DNA glycosylase [Rhodococcus rhodochrous KG-21]
MGEDRVRCPWAVDPPGSTLYRDYHDEEWGRELHGRDELFERLALEAFQSGLSWLTILRKREAFRSAFAGFDVDVVAGYTAVDVDRLLGDAGIVRNRRKIEAVIANARAVLDLRDTDLDTLLWSFAPARRARRLRSVAEVPAVTPESTAMARDLKRRGFAFVGPTTAYALMQATGMVDDHLAECWVDTDVRSASGDIRAESATRRSAG